MIKKLTTNRIKFSTLKNNMIATKPALPKNRIPIAPNKIFTEFSLLISRR